MILESLGIPGKETSCMDCWKGRGLSRQWHTLPKQEVFSYYSEGKTSKRVPNWYLLLVLICRCPPLDICSWTWKGLPMNKNSHSYICPPRLEKTTCDTSIFKAVARILDFVTLQIGTVCHFAVSKFSQRLSEWCRVPLQGAGSTFWYFMQTRLTAVHTLDMGIKKTKNATWVQCSHLPPHFKEVILFFNLWKHQLKIGGVMVENWCSSQYRGGVD